MIKNQWFGIFSIFFSSLFLSVWCIDDKVTCVNYGIYCLLPEKQVQTWDKQDPGRAEQPAGKDQQKAAGIWGPS